ANMTGLTWDIGFAKQFDILKEIIPRLFRVAVLQDPTWGWRKDYWKGAEVAATARGFKMLPFDIRREDDFETAFQKLAQGHSDAIFMSDSPLFWQQNNVILNFARNQPSPRHGVKQRICEEGGADIVRCGCSCPVSPGRRLRQQDPQRRRPGYLSRRAIGDHRIGRQHDYRQDARSDDSVVPTPV